MKGALNTPDGKRPHSHRVGKTEGKHQKAGVVRHSRHEGLAPVPLVQRLDAGSGLGKRTNSCRTSDRSACLFPQVLGLMVQGAPVPFSRSSASRPPGRTDRARASAILKGASPSPRLKRQDEFEMKSKKTRHEPMRTGGVDAARGLL
jgi:hypothetical protein